MTTQEAIRLAVEALEQFKWYVDRYGDDRKDYGYIEQADAALASIRAAQDWHPIAEMAEAEPCEVCCGAWSVFGTWVVTRLKLKKKAIELGYTHFYRQTIPPAPPRAEGGAE